MLEFAYPPSIQANSHFELAIGAQGQGKLTADTVIVGIGAKYQDMCTSVSRTLMIGPNEQQKVGYAYICEVFDTVQRELKAGRTCGDVYKSVMEKSENPMKKFLPKSFGYGIGMTVKEELIAIKSDNTKEVKAGMCFNVRVSLTGFNADGIMAKNCLLISDTLLVLAEGAEVLTRGITRAYGDISYFLEDEEEATTVTNAVKNETPDDEVVCKNVIIEERTREKNKKIKNSDAQTKEGQRQEHQEQLFNEKFEELKARWEEDKCKLGN